MISVCSCLIPVSIINDMSALLSVPVPHKVRKLMVIAQHAIIHGWLENSSLKGLRLFLPSRLNANYIPVHLCIAVENMIYLGCQE